MPRLLISDDDPEMARNMAKFFGDRNWSVQKAHTPEETLKLLTSEFDALVLDLCFSPGGNEGEEVLSQIRHRPDLDSLCVVLLTAYGEVASAVRCMRLGADQYLEKPFEARDLEHLLNSGIARQRANRLSHQILEAVEVDSTLNHVRSALLETLAPEGIFFVFSASDSPAHRALRASAVLERQGLVAPTERRFVSQVLAEHKPVHARYWSEVQQLDPIMSKTRSLVAVPIPGVGGKIIGVMDIESSNEEAFDFSWQETLKHLADLVGIAIELVAARDLLVDRKTVENIRLMTKEISHRVCTSLQVITGHSDFLLKEIGSKSTDDSFEGTLRRRIAAVRETAFSIAAVCKDLENLSEEIHVNKQPFSLWELLDRCTEDFADKAQSMGIRIRLPDHQWRSFTLEADRERLKYSVECLLQNAIEAIEEARTRSTASVSDGSDEISLTVEADETNRVVSINVTDTGTGVPDELRDEVFKPLFTTKDHARSSCGMGLFSVKRYMQAQGGTIALVPNTGRGAMFVLTLPLRHFPGEGQEIGS